MFLLILGISFDISFFRASPVQCEQTPLIFSFAGVDSRARGVC